MTNKIVILDNSIQLYEHYIDDSRWERALAFPRGGVTYLVSNGTIKFYAFEDYLYRNCLISMQLPIRVIDEKRNIDGEYENIDDLTRVLDPIFPSNDIDAELEYYLSIADAERIYQPIGDYALKSEIPDVSNFVTDEELVDALDDYVEKEGFNTYTAETAAIIEELDDRKADKSELSPYFDDASYDSKTREIKFYHNGQVKTQIDATPFIKDGMVNTVRFENGYLIITFNTDAGKKPIAIKIDSIFEPSNYYTKAEIDDNFQPIGNYVSASTYTAFTSTTNASINNLRTTKLDASAYTPSDLSNYYTKDEVYSKLETYNRNEIDDNFQPKGNYVSDSTYTAFTSSTEASIDKLRGTKLDISAYTPSDLSNYYTKAEIGDNFQPIGNYVSASTYTAFTSTTNASIQTLRGTKLDVSAYTPSDLSNYYTKSEVYSKGETYNKNEIDDKIIQSGTFDPTLYYTKGTCDSRFALKNEMPSLDGYATEEWVTSKNYATNAELVTYVNNLQQQINSLMATVSGCCQTQEDVYRWLTIIGEYLCEGKDKYEKQKYQVSHDGGITWEDVTPIQYQKGQLIESDSTDCGYAPQPQYRWQKADTSDYMCSGTSKYYKLYYQVSNDGGQTWENASPEQTKIGDLIESNSSDCGYVTPQYRWYTSQDEYMCIGTTKYEKQYYQVSNDGGETWENVSPVRTRSGSVIEYNSEDCGYVPPTPQYRWVNTSSKICSGYNQYYVAVKQVSNDGGKTWSNVTPTETKLGTLYQADSYNCGYVGTPKLKLYVDSGKMKQLNCESSTNTTLTSADYNGTYNLMGEAACEGLHIEIGDCVTQIGDMLWGPTIGFAPCAKSINFGKNVTKVLDGNGSCENCTKLTDVTLPPNITKLNFGFPNCTSLKHMTIPSKVSVITSGIWANCSSLESLTFLSVTPPDLGEHYASTFKNTNNCTLYVPAESVNAYKAADGWKDYASRIMPINS